MTQYMLSLYQPDDMPPPDPNSPTMQDLHAWIGEVNEAGAWVFGAGLFPASTATVLRPSEGDAILTDGPFVEGKEHIAGFTIIDAPDLDAALECARKLSLARQLPIEVSAVVPRWAQTTRSGTAAGARPATADGEEDNLSQGDSVTGTELKPYLISVYQPDGPPPPPAELEAIMRDVYAWQMEVQAANAWVFGAGLMPPDQAKVLRPQQGEVLMTDGPYIEGKEHLGGFTIIKAADLDAALDWTKRLSLSRLLPLEIRPMVTG